MKSLPKILFLRLILSGIIFAVKFNVFNHISSFFRSPGHSSQPLQLPYLGIRYKIVSPEIATMNHKPEGAYVVKVENDSPAKNSGILPGDIITQIDDQPITNTDLTSFISNQPPHTPLNIQIDRDGQQLSLIVTL